MRNINIEVVEEILEGKISKNPNRFDEANGIVFSINKMNKDMREYFNSKGIEFHELVKDIYYTETIMSVTEFEQLDFVMHIKHIA